MPSPIQALQHNVVWAFENPNECAVDELRRAVNAGLVTPVLDMDERALPPIPPKVEKLPNQPAQIRLHETYLEMVWSWIYGWMVIYEEAVQRKWLEGVFDGRIRYETELTARAALLLNWSSSLRDVHSDWPGDSPAPNAWRSNEEEFYALRANGIYQKAVAYLLHHEFAHIRQGHFGVVDEREHTAEARAIAIQLEREADDFSYRALVAFDDDEDAKRIKAWSILAASLSSLQLIRTPAGLFQGRHPHLHHRIYESLSRLNFHDPRWRGYYGYLANSVLETTLQTITGEFPSEPRVFDTLEEAEADLLARIDRFDPLAPA